MRMKKKLKVLVIFDSAGPPPADQDFSEQFQKEDWFTEAAVLETLQLMGHDVRHLGIYSDIRLILDAIEAFTPDVIFNLTEVFMGKAHLDKNIPALLDMLSVPYTGCSPDGMILCNNKALSKKILSYHRINVPRFAAFRRGHRFRLPKRLAFPLIVKPLREEASTGISQNSYVSSEDQLRERVAFLHDKLHMHAIAEEYIDGRELYVSVIGRRRLEAFPIREMVFESVNKGDPTIATYNAKWDENYRNKWGISNGFASLPEDVTRGIHRVCKRAYRMLRLDGYARFDCRLTPNNELYIIEGNANPELAQGDEFAESAAKAGLTYDVLLTRILRLAIQGGDS